MNELAAEHPLLVVALPKVVILLFVMLTALAYLTWFERKVVAHIQARWDRPRRPARFAQPLADGVKFLFKEDMTPAGADKFAYFLAPFLALSLAITSIAMIPFGPEGLTMFGQATPTGHHQFEYRPLDFVRDHFDGSVRRGVGRLGFQQQISVAGGLRSSAQMISYELALTMSVVV